MKMVASIGERLAAKLGNANDNAFKMRRLFKMYDADCSGRIHLDDLRMMMETFGIQLDDDSLLALYYVYDKGCTGYLEYDALMKVLLDADYYALYCGANDVTQVTGVLPALAILGLSSMHRCRVLCSSSVVHDHDSAKMPVFSEQSSSAWPNVRHHLLVSMLRTSSRAALRH